MCSPRPRAVSSNAGARAWPRHYRSERPHRQHDVIKDGELRQQEVELEDEAERGEPHLAALGLAHARGGAAADQHLAAGWQIEQAKEIKQRRLSGPDGPVMATNS